MEVIPHSEGFDATTQKIVTEKKSKKVVQRLHGKSDMRWQSAVRGMGHLIEIVADPPQLREQRWLHAMQLALGDLKLATEDQRLAVCR